MLTLIGQWDVSASYDINEKLPHLKANGSDEYTLNTVRLASHFTEQFFSARLNAVGVRRFILVKFISKFKKRGFNPFC